MTKSILQLTNAFNLCEYFSMNPPDKPFLRGRFHQEAFFFALGAGAMLIANTKGTRPFIATLVYVLSLIILFGVSALYHRRNWNEVKRKWFRRLDHSAIFISIAGTATPLCILAIPGKSGDQLLFMVWLAATVGILQSLFWVKAPKWIAAILYVIVGWLAVPYLNEFKASMGFLSTALILGGGVIYTLGALVYALKKPNPAPLFFGYHEIFHLLVIVAATMHFIAIARLINSLQT